MSNLLIRKENQTLYISLNKPEVRNAFDDKLISEITAVFKSVDARAVVLSGEGKVFCAGGDLEWMKSSIDLSEEENKHDAEKLAVMFETIDSCPCPVIGKVHGAAFGGGLGLACVCDIVFASEGTKFCFSEVKLGLAPAVIAPYAVRKIGEGNARRYFLTAEVFDSREAMRIGLVHDVLPYEELDGKTNEVLKSIKQCGPNAIRQAKSLIRDMRNEHGESIHEKCINAIAKLRVSEEGQEGVKAFLEKRSAKWIEEK